MKGLRHSESAGAERIRGAKGSSERMKTVFKGARDKGNV